MPRYSEMEDVGDAGGNDQVVGWVNGTMDEVGTDAMVQGVKGGVEALIPAEVPDDVMDDRDDDLGVALDVELAEVLGMEDVDGVMSDTFSAGALSYATAAGWRGTEEHSAQTAGPGRAARELEGLLEATAGAAPGFPKEGVEELELREVLVGAEKDAIEGPGDTGDIKAMEVGVGDLNKLFKTLCLVMYRLAWLRPRSVWPEPRPS